LTAGEAFETTRRGGAIADTEYRKFDGGKSQREKAYVFNTVIYLCLSHFPKQAMDEHYDFQAAGEHQITANAQPKFKITPQQVQV